jgi:hypothetical protein
MIENQSLSLEQRVSALEHLAALLTRGQLDHSKSIAGLTAIENQAVLNYEDLQMLIFILVKHFVAISAIGTDEKASILAEINRADFTSDQRQAGALERQKKIARMISELLKIQPPQNPPDNPPGS